MIKLKFGKGKGVKINQYLMKGNLNNKSIYWKKINEWCEKLTSSKYGKLNVT